MIFRNFTMYFRNFVQLFRNDASFIINMYVIIQNDAPVQKVNLHSGRLS